MKRKLSFLLVAAMVLSLLAACDADDGVRQLGTLKKYNDDKDDVQIDFPLEEETEPVEETVPEEEFEQEQELETVYLISKITVSGLSVETYQYDANGFVQESKMVDTDGREIDYCDYEVDERGCPIGATCRTYGEPYEWTFEYDKQGNLLERAYFDEEMAGYRVEYTYDDQGNRLEEKTYYDETLSNTVSYEYSGYGELISGTEVSDYDGDVNRELYYDGYGRLVRSYTYPTEMDDAMDINYTCDDNGCLQQSTTSFGGYYSYTTTYEYITIQTTAKQAEILRKVQNNLQHIYNYQ